MPVGRPISLIGRRFAVLPKYRGFWIYAAELSNRMVKIGCTTQPRTRMLSLQKKVKRDLGADILNVHVVPTEWNHYGAEEHLIKRMRILGRPVGKTFEYFTHIQFSDVVEHLKDVAKKPDICGPQLTRFAIANAALGHKPYSIPALVG